MQINIPGYDSGIRWLHTYWNLISGDNSPDGEVNDCVAEPEAAPFHREAPEVYV